MYVYLLYMSVAENLIIDNQLIHINNLLSLMALTFFHEPGIGLH